MAIEPAVPLLKRRRTRIVATLGPASSSQSTIEALLARGVDVFRLNFSHGAHEDHAATFAAIKAAAAQVGNEPAVLADLCGPKIRTGRFAGGAVHLEGGAEVTVTTRDVEGTAELIPSQYAGITGDVRAGARILLDDGKLELEVLAIDGTDIKCRVRHGGELKDRKGINLPDSAVSAPSLTDKDRDDARFALSLGVDWLALSFVRCAADLTELREIIDESDSPAGIVAKIEKPEALRDIDAILDACDAVMVARGDLGVELLPEQVPVAQDLLVREARARHRPVIVATQMLESMIVDARPTRAEVADVAHAVMSGTDAVMLSAETASGAHPLEAVAMMDRIARQAEGWLWAQGAFGTIERAGNATGTARALATATAQLSRDLGVRAVVVVSRSGLSAGIMSAARPAAPIIAVSSSAATCRRLRLSWGLVPRLVTEADLADAAALACAQAQALDIAGSGDIVLLVQGFQLEAAASRPSVSVLSVP
ncbi:MAG: pyruvate kinase [Gammaproteobacteria bacterium]